MRIRTLDELVQVGNKGARSLLPDRPKLVVGTATCGLASGADEVLTAVQEEVDRLGANMLVAQVGCAGFCEREPLVDVILPGKPRITYEKMTAQKASQLVAALARGELMTDSVLGRTDEDDLIMEGKTLAYASGPEGDEFPDIPLLQSLPFYRRQQKIAMRYCGIINPESIEEYIACGGYRALNVTLKNMRPESVVEQMKMSGLRGRGGGGFPTGRKWESCRNAHGEPKYVMCNADEGDPGAYMDRSLLEGDPHSVLEGMIIGAYAIGSHEGYIYVRAEYPLAVERLRKAIDQAERYGLLGRNIFDTAFDFSIKINMGGGAFVCGESTALMASLEGRAGEPRAKYIHTVESGLWSRPSNLNNVETWANVPAIIARGADWYAGIGSKTSKGTKVFSLVGKISNTGLVEVPMGMPLREIVYDIGGGIPGGRKFKAVQTGGPSGGCIPESLIDTPVDFDRLWELGSMMGSGGMIVMDEDTCMVDVAKYFIEFLSDESCGKCVPCRVGLDRMYQLLVDITEGRGKEGDLELLEELSAVLMDTCLCALGTSAPNPVMSTIRYFREEYEEHIKYKRCSAAVCRKIISSGCQHTCPLGTDVPVYVALIAKGEYLKAAEVIREKNPLPGICGRVCHHPCESKCTLGQFNDPVAINDLKRFAIDYEREHGVERLVEPVKPTHEKVAIIGSGPAGLTAAHSLTTLGYQVTIFEALPIPGGMLAVGIPKYRLPREILDYDISKLLALGIELKTNTRIGKDLTLEDLKKQGYKAILLAVGLHQSKPLPIEGTDLAGVLKGVPFLQDVALERPVNLGKRVVIIGGGNVAIDCARSALRLGAGEVHMAFLEPREAMLAHPWDIEEALEEGIVFHPDKGPVKLLGRDGKVTGLEIIDCVSIFDEEGRFNPTFKPGTESVLEADTVIISIGQTNDFQFLAGVEDGVKRMPQGTVAAEAETLMTEVPGLFVAGDLSTGPDTVTRAMATGKIAAESIHRYLRGLPLEREYRVTRPMMRVEPLEFSDEEVERIAQTERCRVPELAVKERTRSFAEVRGCFDEQTAVAQAKRCVRCELEVLEDEETGQDA